MKSLIRNDCDARGAYRADSHPKRSVACERVRGKPVYNDLLPIVLCLTIIQCLFLAIKQIVFSNIAETLYSRSMVTMISMIAALALMLLYCKHKKYGFSAFPKAFGLSYTIVTLIAAGFYGVTLFFVKTFSLQSALMLLYASIVTPIFEELLFRGVIWNRLNKRFSQEWKTYLTVTVLFALWHIGYAVGLYLWNGGSLLSCIVMKVTVGAVFGLLTGAIRWKTKNCYCGILLHGILNALG